MGSTLLDRLTAVIAGRAEAVRAHAVFKEELKELWRFDFLSGTSPST